MPHWSQEELNFFADLIATGYVERTREIDETVTWTNLMNLRVQGIETTFFITKISKGSIPTNRIVLHHYRAAITNQFLLDGPNFTTLNLRVGDTNKYLLYLKKEKADRYEPLTGPIFPHFSVIRQSER